MNELTNIVGSVEMEVRLLDGKAETVCVRQLKLRLLPVYAGLMQDEAACVELFCDKPKDWADTLTLESAEAVLLKGQELNADFLKRSVERAKALRERIQPGAQAREEALMREVASDLAARIGSQFPLSPSAPTPPSSVAAPSSQSST